MHFTLKIWRQENADVAGGIRTYEVDDISGDTSLSLIHI